MGTGLYLRRKVEAESWKNGTSSVAEEGCSRSRGCEVDGRRSSGNALHRLGSGHVQFSADKHASPNIHRGGDEKVDPVTPDSDAECGVPPSTFTDMH